jgi:hypothetical protein
MKTIIFSVVINLVVISTFAQKTNEIIFYDFVPDNSIIYLKNGTIYSADSLRCDINSDLSNEIMFNFDPISPIIADFKVSSLRIDWQFCWVESDTMSSNTNIWRTSSIWRWDEFQNDKIGVRFTQGEDYYYGWIRAYVSSIDTAVFINVDKMAYCTIPNYPLLWGQTEISNSVPKTDAGNDGVKINFSNAANTVQIESITKIKEVEIVNSRGQIVKKARNVGRNETEINVSGLQSGVYIVKVSLDDGRVVSGKIVR